MDERDQLVHTLAQACSGHKRDNVVNAGGILILNALRQSHRFLTDAERELDDLVARMRAVLRENHYRNGERRVTEIIIPSLRELLRDIETGG